MAWHDGARQHQENLYGHRGNHHSHSGSGAAVWLARNGNSQMKNIIAQRVITYGGITYAPGDTFAADDKDAVYLIGLEYAKAGDEPSAPAPTPAPQPEPKPAAKPMKATAALSDKR